MKHPLAYLLAALLVLIVLLPGCIYPTFNIKLFSDYYAPLREHTLSGEGADKIAIIPVTGVISDKSVEGLGGTRPSMVQELVAQLNKAARDPSVKSAVLVIDSPGGTVTASDIAYRELMKFRKRTGVKIVTAMMDLAASGGYYVAAATDRIVAHPTTVTGSIGVIFVRPNIVGLMEKIGARAVVTKSGAYKDMGSPFREPTEEEDRLFRSIIDEYHGRFVAVVAEGRGMDPETVRKIADGRVLTGEQALGLGLVDRVGYLADAVEEARGIAGVGEDARLVVYRRSDFADDTLYNTATAQSTGVPALIDLGLDGITAMPDAGFHYLWLPAETE
jgi:protease-4